MIDKIRILFSIILVISTLFTIAIFLILLIIPWLDKVFRKPKIIEFKILDKHNSPKRFNKIIGFFPEQFFISILYENKKRWILVNENTYSSKKIGENIELTIYTGYSGKKYIF